MPEPLVQGKWYEDFVVGEELISAGRTVGEGAIDLFAGLTGDFSQVHTDAQMMQESEFGERIAHGLFTLSIMQGLMWRTNYTQGTGVATIGWDKLKFVAPVKIGDTVRARWTIKEKRLSKSRPHLGIIIEECRLVNQRQETVLTGEHATMVRRKPGVPGGA